jgi:hypothetical protein
MKLLKALVGGLALGLVSLPASAGFFTVTSPGPLDGFEIRIQIDNADGFDLLRATFDLSGTEAAAPGMQTLTIEPPPFNVVDPPGGTATFFQISDTVFGFDFTGFNDGETFSFDWDPDIAGDIDYSATVVEQVGMLITLDVAGATVGGTLQIDSDGFGLIAVIASPVPEPASLVLLGAALAGLALARRRVS